MLCSNQHRQQKTEPSAENAVVSSTLKCENKDLIIDECLDHAKHDERSIRPNYMGLRRKPRSR